MVSKGDLILLELEGRDVKGNVFDSTSGDIAKKLHGKEGPLLLSYGFDRIILGLFEVVGKMRKGESQQVSLGPDKAFGRRKKELIKILSLTEFKKYHVKPEVGLLIHVDTDNGRTYGTIKSVGNGRVMVDFNHPLAGQHVNYSIKLVDVFITLQDKVKALCDDSGIVEKWEYNGGVLKLKFRDMQSSEEEARRALLLISLRDRVQELSKVEVEGRSQPEATKKD